ncbi:MAG: hypothetical protein H7330_07435 [Hymenobacteraceae bacterium]|nr:hypothetical protein [Hymenobacteraceae bacterium]
MPTKCEGATNPICFDFPIGWEAVKYDEEGGFYRTTVTKHVNLIRGMDLVAVPPGAPRVVFIEVKDFRKAAPDDPEARNAKLIDTVLRKTLYTLAGLVAAERVGEASLRPFAMLSRQPPVQVVLFLVEAPLASKLRQQNQRVGRNDLEQSLTAQLAAWGLDFALRGAPTPLVPPTLAADGWEARVA